MKTVRLELYRVKYIKGGKGNYKVCKFCNARAYSGVVVRRNEMIRAFVCTGCAQLLRQTLTAKSGTVVATQEV